VTARRNRLYVSKSWKVGILKNEAQDEVRIFWENLLWWDETFSKASTEFLWTLRICSGYLGGPPSIAFCVSKKIVNLRHTNQKILTKTLKKFSRHEMFSIISILLYKAVLWRVSSLIGRVTKNCVSLISDLHPSRQGIATAPVFPVPFFARERID